MKFIIDTDIGDDIDDAFALDFALKRKLDLICVTTVFRNTEERARIAKKLLTLYGRGDIPVYAGQGEPLAGGERYDGRLCQWTEDLSNYPPDGDRAVEAILDAARTYGKELKIVAIGPFTNIARAIERDETAMEGVGELVIMGGDFSRHYASWNVRCDVEAAQTVFSSRLNITAFGSDFTSAVRLNGEQQEYVFSMAQDGYHAYLAQLARLWYASKREGTKIELHDLLTVLYAAEPQRFATRRIPVAVETKGRWTRGITVDCSRMEDMDCCGREIETACRADLARFQTDFMEQIGFQRKDRKEVIT